MEVSGIVTIAKEPKLYDNDKGPFASVMVEELVGKKEKRYTWVIVAFNEVAEDIAAMSVGQKLEFKGYLSKYKNKKTENWETSIIASKLEKLADIVEPELPAAEEDETALPFDL